MNDGLIKVPFEIIQTLTFLPDGELLTKIKNLDQLIVWGVMNCKNRLLAESWNARHTGKDEPLNLYLERGIINKEVYESLLLTLDYFDSLWVLCQRVYPKILVAYQQKNINCPFENAFSLFKILLINKQNATFSYYLKDYVEFSARKGAKALKLYAKQSRGEKLSNDELVFLEKFSKKNLCEYESRTENLVLKTAKKFANRNHPAIHRAYTSVMENQARLDEIVSRSARKQPSHIMENGQITKRGKRGGYFD